MGKQWKQWQTLIFGDPKSLQMVTAAMKLQDTYSHLDSTFKITSNEVNETGADYAE